MDILVSDHPQLAKLFRANGLGHVERFVIPENEWSVEYKHGVAQHPEESFEQHHFRAVYRWACKNLQKPKPLEPPKLTAKEFRWWAAGIVLLLIALGGKLAHGQGTVVVRGAAAGTTPAANATVTSVDANHKAIDVNVAAGGGTGGGPADAAPNAAASESDVARQKVSGTIRVLDTGQAAGSQLVTAKGDQSSGLWVNCKAGCSAAGDTSTGSTALGAANAVITIALAGERGAAFQLQSGGTGIYTVTPQCSFDGGTIYNSNGYLQDPVTGVISLTATIASAQATTDYQVICPSGASNTQMKVTAYTSGTANWLARATVNTWPAVAFGIVTTNAPSYTTGTINGFSLDAAGLLRVSLKDTPANTNKLLVTADAITFASPQAVTQSGTWSTRTQDGAGNAITTNSTTYTAKFAFDTNLLGTLGTAFSTAGKVDVKGADGDVFVRQATAANLNGTMVGTKTNNNAAPGATNFGVLPALANAADPAWTEGDLVTQSVDLSGFARTKISNWLGSAAPTVGSKTSANSIPVVIASDQGAVTVAQATAASLKAEVVGTKTNNNAVPGATNFGVLPYIANAAQQTWTEGDLVLGSVNLKGSERAILQDAAGNDRGVNVDANNNAQASIIGRLADNGVAAATDRAATTPGIYQSTYLNGTAATQGRNAALSVGKDGLLWTAQLPAIRPASYHWSGSFAGSSTTFAAHIAGNATNTLLVTKIAFSCTQTTAGNVTVTVNKTSAASTGGTAATLTAVPDDSTFAGASSVAQSFTGTGPTVGTPVGQIDAYKLGCLATATAAPNDIYILNLRQKPIVLRGTAETLEIGVGAAVTGGNYTVTFEGMEITTISP